MQETIRPKFFGVGLPRDGVEMANVCAVDDDEWALGHVVGKGRLCRGVMGS